MPVTTKLTPLLIQSVKLLRMHGYSYTKIANELDISYGAAHKYGKDVIVLPEKLRKDPWGDIEKLDNTPQLKIREKGDFKSALREKEYWRQEHEKGTPFEGPLNLFSLDELIEMMEEPTNYISPLNQTDWYDYYIAPTMFLGENPSLTDTQIIVNHFLDNHRYGLVKVHRGAGKTVLVIGRIIRPICEHREENYAIQSEARERSMERLMSVSNHLATNKRLIAHYGYLPLDKPYRGIKATWRLDSITVKRDTIQTDPTLKAVSWKDAKLLGGHFHGVLFDDPWSEKLEQNNEKNKERWFRWYDSTLVGCMEAGAWQHIICTSKGLYDIYRDLEDRGLFNVYIQPAVWEFPSDYEYTTNEQGKITGVVVNSNDWHISDDGHGRFSIEFFLMQKALAPTGFEMEYQLNPLPERGRYFDWDNIKLMNGLGEFFKMFDSEAAIGNCKIVGSMDIATGKTERSHYTALAILAYYGDKYYLLQTYMKRGSSKVDKAKMIERAKREFPWMNIVYMEADFSQSTYVEDVIDLVKSVRIEPVFSRQEEVKMKKADIGKLNPKHARIISQMDEIVELQKLIINTKINDFKEFEREVKEFPRSQYDDLIDAVGNGISKLKKTRYKLFGFSG